MIGWLVTRTPTQITASVLAGLAIWWLYAWHVEVKTPELALFAPDPVSVGREGVALLGDSNFWAATWISNQRVLLGFFISTAIGVPVGLLLGAYREYRGLAAVATDFVRYIPVAAVIPLGILWLGIGEAIKVFVLVLGTVFQLVVMVSDNARRVPNEMLESALSLGVPKRKAIWSVLLPAAAPAIFDSLRVAMGFCWTYLMMAEVVAPLRGLGHLINYSQKFLRIQTILAIVLFLGVVGLLYDTLFVVIRRRLFPWVGRGPA